MNAFKNTADVITTLAKSSDNRYTIELANQCQLMADPANHKPRGTVKAWFAEHHAEIVDTVQVQPSKAWAPLNRSINSESFSGKVLLDGSAREYAGMKVLHADDDMLFASYEFGGTCYVLYSLI